MSTRPRKTARALDAFFAEDGPLASRKRGHARRPGQVALAHAVSRTLSERGVLLADAPTGTGKGLAYLAPAILRAASSGEKVVVSSATLALQAQLLAEDIPPAQAAVSKLLGFPPDEGVTHAVMKGRRNYLRGQRFQDTLRAAPSRTPTFCPTSTGGPRRRKAATGKT